MWNKLTKTRRDELLRVFQGLLFFFGALFLPFPTWGKISLLLITYLRSAYPLLRKAFRDLRNLRFFTENDLMVYASLGAICLGEYEEAVAVVLFYALGEWFEGVAIDQSRHSMTELLSLKADNVSLETEQGIIDKDPSEAQIGDIFVVKAGERIALDGKVLEGESSVDTSSLTGESFPRNVMPGDEVSAGFWNKSAYLRIEVIREEEDSAMARIIQMVEEAAEQKSEAEKFSARFARYYTPIVVAGAIVLLLIPLFVGDWATWVHRSLNFLVVSCPCALVISVPLSFFGGIGGASRKGILVKGGDVFEKLAQVDTMVFDKTGTLSQGSFSIAKIVCMSTFSEDDVLQIAASLEKYSSHPLASAFPQGKKEFRHVQELAGRGLQAQDQDTIYRLGNRALMEENGLIVPEANQAYTILYLSKDDELIAYFLLQDKAKPEASQALHLLREKGIRYFALLSGDRQEVAMNFASQLDIDEVEAELYPEAKLQKIVALQKSGKVAYVGDGINDAPSLVQADVGIAMGKSGSGASVESADVVLMDDHLLKLVSARDIAKKTVRIAQENVLFAIGVKIAILLLSAIGLANMWMAVFGDVGVTILCIMNAGRCFYSPHYGKTEKENS